MPKQARSPHVRATPLAAIARALATTTLAATALTTLITILALPPAAYARDPQDALTRRSRAAEPAQKWIGKPITIKTTNVELAELFRLIAEASGFNLILGDGVQGTIRAIDWQDVPWDQALDMILKSKHLRAEREGNMLRIVSHDEFIREVERR